MAGNNSDYLRRLKKDGRTDLLDKIEAGEMSPYAASIEAGYRKRSKSKSRSEHLTYHWRRADAVEKQRFLIDNWNTIAPFVGTMAKRAMADEQDKKSSQ